MQLYIFVAAGLVLANVFHVYGVQDARLYSLAIAALLAVGLYSSTYGISIKEARKHARLIITAVTVGVLVKSLLIGVLLALLLHNAFGFILGIIVAQIDPLSTAALLSKKSRLSKRAKTIIAAWSSFDDPVTVILSLYAPVLVSVFLGKDALAVGAAAHVGSLASYASDTAFNIVFAAAVFCLWQLVRRYTRTRRYVVLLLVAVATYVLFAAAMTVAVYYFWMLGVAIIGLFMRPPIENFINNAVQWALSMAALLLGLLLVHGINLTVGLVLGVATFGSQIIVGFLLTRTLSKQDRIHIALAQQNGITAIILALLFEPYFPGTIAIVAPAIITVNVLHQVSNIAVEFLITHDRSALSLQASGERVRAHLGQM